MTIHHTQLKKAEKMGVTLTEEGDTVVAFWPKRSLRIVGASVGDAMQQMQAAQAIMSNDARVVRPDPDQPRLVTVELLADDDAEPRMILSGSPMPPVAAHKLIIQERAEWVDVVDAVTGDSGGADPDLGDTGGVPDPNLPAAPIERINGIAVDGRVAYSEGTPAGDCPYSSETDDDAEYANFERWNEEWDAAADEHEEEEGPKGSVVSEKYRSKYAEMGHPTHCGDWLAETLNELCQNKGGTNLELFEHICSLNGVDTSKYKRSGIGWEGRIRMTGRNLMAKRVFLADGLLILPETINGGSMKAPAEWMATQRYKRAAKAA